jgi:hypothetical protein
MMKVSVQIEGKATCTGAVDGEYYIYSGRMENFAASEEAKKWGGAVAII